MFCKVCKDAGKKETVYTSHWVRDAAGPTGKIVCPTLLTQECRYCKEKGHTPKHCPKNEIKKKTQTENHYTQRARNTCSSPPPPPAREAYQPKVIPFQPTPGGEIQRQSSYQNDLEKSFPVLGEEKTTKIVNALFPTTAVKSYSTAATTTTAAKSAAKYEREDSPTPSPVSSRPHTPPPAPKKMPIVKEEEEDSKSSNCYPLCPSTDCLGTPSLSPTPPPRRRRHGRVGPTWNRIDRIEIRFLNKR